MNSNRQLQIIIGIGAVCLGLGIYSVLNKPASPQPSPSQPSPSLATPVSQPLNARPACVITYPSGSCWTIQPPKEKCGRLSVSKPSVSISGNTCTIIVVPTAAQGIQAIDDTGHQFVINKGDTLDIQATGLVNFSIDHPCAPPDGVNGWYDPYVDSPYTQNVGGLEFSIGPLSSNRHFAGSHVSMAADTTGVPTFRVVDRATGYDSNNSGAFTVTLTKR